MGNKASLPEKVFAAVEKNDVAGFQNLMAHAAAADPVVRSRVLEHKDKNGRTPLLLAAARNRYQILQQLIRIGANVHYINPAKDSAGGALHEAASRCHEAVVELLLASGANPFAANAAGRTALDEAVLSGHTGVVRAIEKYAEFAGMVGFKTRAMAGLSSKYKARWAVLMPYHPFVRDPSSNPAGRPASASGPSQKRRRCLWLYKDKASVSPRCRLWVDGATVLTAGPAGTEGTLRLHTSHGEPMGDLATYYSHGYCVSLRPADLTPTAAAEYQRLVSLLNTSTHLSGGPTTPAAPLPPAAGPNPSFMPGPSPVPSVIVPATPQAPSAPGGAPAGFYPHVPPVAVFGGGGAGAAAYMVPPSTPPGVATGPASAVAPSAAPSAVYPAAAGFCPMASPLSLHQQQRQAAALGANSSGSPGAAAAAAVRPGEQLGARPTSEPAPPQSQQPPQQQQPRQGAVDGKCGPVVGSGGGVVDGVFIERMAALPGESDEAFAARLASAISATSGQSQQHLFPPPSASAASTADAAQPGPQRPSVQPVSGSGGQSVSAAGAQPWTSNSGVDGTAATANLINFHSDPGDQNVGQIAGQFRRPAGALDMDAVNAVLASDTAGASGSSGPAGPSGGAGPSSIAPAGPAAIPTLTPPSPPSCTKEGLELPSAPPAEAFGGGGSLTAAAAAPPRPPEADAECVICMCAPKEVGFLHGDTVHRCVCRGCSVHVPVGSPCPLCRRTVERVLGIY